jgi:hypothetical protein
MVSLVVLMGCGVVIVNCAPITTQMTRQLNLTKKAIHCPLHAIVDVSHHAINGTTAKAGLVVPIANIFNYLLTRRNINDNY